VQAVNADIDMWLPANSNFEWGANTINGDMLSDVQRQSQKLQRDQSFTASSDPGGTTIKYRVDDGASKRSW